jgi:hypothetical protein
VAAAACSSEVQHKGSRTELVGVGRHAVAYLYLNRSSPAAAGCCRPLKPEGTVAAVDRRSDMSILRLPIDATLGAMTTV